MILAIIWCVNISLIISNNPNAMLSEIPMLSVAFTFMSSYLLGTFVTLDTFKK